ncbi:MAG: amidohydrolase [Eubacteriales bacterium]|nr:amidohydrolase [Eubacteriales bacterium]
MKEWFDKIPVKEMIEWRRHIHQNPELSFKEYKTSEFVKEKLRSFGNIEIVEPAGTSVLGILKGDFEGKTILLRADMDALPMQEESDVPYRSACENVAHTCGHDVHTAMLLATAKVLSEMKDQLHGTVKFIFQHAEELNPGGANDIVKSGVLDDVDAVIGLHVITNLEAGSIHVHLDGPSTTAVDAFSLNIQGKGSHGSMPQNGIDPIIVGADIINGLQKIVSRYVTPGELTVITVGEFKAGDAPNIIPDKAYMSASIRTVNEETRQKVAQRIRDVIDKTCQIYGATYDLDYTFSYPAVINDKDVSKLVMDSAKEVLGEDKVAEISLTSASEDFAYYRQIAPVSFVQLGGGTAEDGCGYANHHPKFAIKEEAMEAGVKTEVQSVLNFLK